MKFLAILAAGALAASAMVPAVADASPKHGWKWKKECHWVGHGKWRHNVCTRKHVRW